MNRKTSTQRPLLLAAACLATALAVPGAASAQCSQSCNQATHHWANLGFSDADQTSYVGMVFLLGAYWPAMCVGTDPKNLMLAGVDQTRSYPTPQLTANASFCMLGGNDKITMVKEAITCYVSGSANTLHPIDNNGRQLVISGGAGNDNLTLGLELGTGVGTVGDHALCGGAGNDTGFGGYDHQYISGGTGNDFLNGGRQDDEVRGGDDQDVILHPNFEQTDTLRAEGQSDCMYVGVNAPTDSGTSCGASLVYTDYWQSNGKQPTYCDEPVASCCANSPAC